MVVEIKEKPLLTEAHAPSMEAIKKTEAGVRTKNEVWRLPILLQSWNSSFSAKP